MSGGLCRTDRSPPVIPYRLAQNLPLRIETTRISGALSDTGENGDHCGCRFEGRHVRGRADCPGTALPFAFQGFVVDSCEQVDIFQQQCRFVSIDRSRSLNEHYAPPGLSVTPPERRAARANPSEDAGHQEFSPRPKSRKRKVRRRRSDFLHSQDDNNRPASCRMSWPMSSRATIN